MKPLRIWMGLSLCAFSLHAAVSTEVLKRVVPANIVLDEHPDAKKELIEQIEACGEGVVKGSKAPNRCTHQISLDADFFRPLLEKTGFIYDSDWPYQDGITWITATKKEMDDVPAKWDLSDNSDMIRITHQQCGDCWAQSTRANLEQLILTWTMVRAPLSTQTMISSCCDHGSCSGGYMSAADFMVKYGLPLEERDPYQDGRNSKCKFDMSKDVMDYKLYAAPYVGKSSNFSRAIPEHKRTSAKVQDIMANMIKFDSNAIVTIQAISQSGGVITNCSAINSGGNHMQNIVGWYDLNGERIARVQNSYGTGHGQDGYTHIKWECGDGKLNRGLAKQARVGIIVQPAGCQVPEAYVGPTSVVRAGKGIRLGKAPRHRQNCKWVPTQGLNDPHSCNPIANPDMDTEYHLTASTDCGSASAMILVRAQKSIKPNHLRTPHGVIHWTEN